MGAGIGYVAANAGIDVVLLDRDEDRSVREFAAVALGVKDLRWFPSASFPCHEPQIAHLESGVIHHIEGQLYSWRPRMASYSAAAWRAGRNR